MTDIKITFGCAVRLRRKQLGLVQSELAALAGLHRTYVSDIERGARNITLDSVGKLAGALQISIPELFQLQPAWQNARRPAELN